ncbi:uncharacterized protein c19h1orf216 isoform X2 [Genypterus blacodes]|uniref:uncharacterized protein c19h1orf216 isoform X2 n=1 Tax=Genypterus blacodes TaxID=154954 RepID=UPI003F7745CF
MGEAQSRSVMLQHQDQPLNSAYRGQGGTADMKDGNFNFLPGKGDDSAMMSGNGGDENRNPVRPRNLGPFGRDPPTSSLSSGFHHTAGILSPRSRLPCWSTLEPLPEIESGDDGYGRVPPDGAEEGRIAEEDGRKMIMMAYNEEKQREMRERMQRRKGSVGFRGAEDQEDILDDDDDEWGDSESDSDLSYSGGSMSSINMESGGDAQLMGGWDRIGVGEPRSNQEETDLTRKWNAGTRDPAGRRRSVGQKSLPGTEDRDRGEQSTDSDGGASELMDVVWTLRDRERFKAQEMEKHQVQVTMYRRLALIRWVRTLQSRVQEQQNRLQSSFDVILTQRKELLRMGAAVAMAPTVPAPAGVSQS